MAVAFTSSTQISGTGTSVAWTSFAVSGTNPFILLKIVGNPDGGDVTVSSVVLSAGLTGGTTAEVVSILDSSLNNRIAIWRIPAPSGTGTITATLSTSVAWKASAELWAGVDQTAPAPIADAASVQSGSSPIGVTPANLTANDAASGITAGKFEAATPTHNQTQVYADGGSVPREASGYNLGTGAINASWVTPEASNTYAGVRIVAAASSETPLTWLPVTRVVRGRAIRVVPSGFNPGTKVD